MKPQVLRSPPFLLLSVILWGACAQDVHAFETQDPVTDDSITCDMCSPGMYVPVLNTPDRATRCAWCREHCHKLWKYFRCRYCNDSCPECSAVTNQVCRCKAGYYRTKYSCLKHTECKTGYGVKTRGTPQSDTVCEMCPDGFFSSSSSALEPCVKQQKCANGQIKLLTNSLNPTVCGTCGDLQHGGVTFKSFLFGLFSGLPVKQMRKFVTSYIDKSAPGDREQLLQQIRAWLDQTPYEDLKNLRQKLRSVKLKPVAKLLKVTLQKIKGQSPGCSLEV